MNEKLERRDYDKQIVELNRKIDQLKECTEISLKATIDLRDLLASHIAIDQQRFDVHEKKISPMWDVYVKGEWPARAFFWIFVTGGAVFIAAICKKIFALLSLVK